MKLLEIISFDPTKTKRTAKAGEERSKKAFDKELGAGFAATVYSTGSDKRLNQVTKMGKAGRVNRKDLSFEQISKITNDGYLAYISAVKEYENSGKFNPYFPRVDDIKIFQESDGKIHYRINLEKLYSIHTEKIYKNTDLIRSLIHNMFDINDNQIKDENPEETLLYLMLRLDYPTMRAMIKDNNLIEALDLISGLRRGGKFSFDLGASNMMWRVTGSMPQIVITDPLI